MCKTSSRARSKPTTRIQVVVVAIAVVVVVVEEILSLLNQLLLQLVARTCCLLTCQLVAILYNEQAYCSVVYGGKCSNFLAIAMFQL